MSAQFPEMNDEPRREKAAQLPDDDVVGILPRQHARIRALFEEVRGAEGARFAALEGGCTPEQRQTMGRRLLTAERAAPTHPHPTAAGSPVLQWTPGPFASLLDRDRDALGTRP
ncbi:hypothetical protein [Streptomyces sp. NPDC006334]|uniref:hypothetical protein n=1 Tax=Streptomyces sp. NPDC006334 TaxID=3156754 RepID=UPI00339E88E4